MTEQKLEAISSEPIRQNLRKLRELMPDNDDLTYRFGEFLADRMGNSTINPGGFNIVAQLALYDLGTGASPRPGFPIRQDLVGYPASIYAILRMQIPDIAKAVCPTEFSEGVKDFYEKAMAKSRE